MSSNVTGCPQRRSCFIIILWNCFWVVTSCSGLSHVILFFYKVATHNIFTCKFTKTKLHVRFYYKAGQFLCITKQRKCYYIQIGQLFCFKKQGRWYYKVGHVLQVGTNTTKFGKDFLPCNFYKESTYHKVGELLQSRAIKLALTWR